MRISFICFILILTQTTNNYAQNLSASFEGIGLNLDVNIDIGANEATIIMSGPEMEWYAFGFGGFEMEGTFAITAENDGGTIITERTLGDHNEGEVLSTSITSTDVSIVNGIRTITLSLPATAGNYDFPNHDSVVSFIAATGFGDTLSYHGYGNYNQGVANTATGLAFSTVVPVAWSRFDLEDVKGRTHLMWETESEISNAGFYVQRSLDARSWEDLKFVEGINNVASSYEYIDKETLPGVNYYRLKQVDFDGTIAFSAIKSIEIRGSKIPGDIAIFPNPVDDFLNLEMEASSEIKRIQIIDMNFKILTDEIWSPETAKHTLNVSNYPAGHYLISVKHKDWSYTTHFVKQ